MRTVHAGIVIATLFTAISLAGATLIFTSLSPVSIPLAACRASLFVIIMACLHIAGFILYVKQFELSAAESKVPAAAFDFAASYWAAIKFGIIVQAIFGILTALMLDGGRSFSFFELAFLGHWAGILLIVVRRPRSPATTDIIFVRWGLPILLFATGAIAPYIWKIIGESTLSGWERLLRR